MYSKIRSYQDLIVWQKSVSLTLAVYRLTSDFPKSELFGLISQIRRAAVSVASNIAEGYTRKSQKEFSRFLLIALSSAAELETQLIIAERLKFGRSNNFIPVVSLLKEVLKLLNFFIKANQH